MNRDWFAQTQPETRGRLRVFLDWYPHVAADLHEMGGDSTYYFAPPAQPSTPHFSAAQREWLDTFGRAIAARFDEAGRRTSSATCSTASTRATASRGP